MRHPDNPQYIGHWTVNVQGECKDAAIAAGYKAYSADGITAIELPNRTKTEAHRIAAQFGVVLYIFE